MLLKTPTAAGARSGLPVKINRREFKHAEQIIEALNAFDVNQDPVIKFLLTLRQLPQNVPFITLKKQTLNAVARRLSLPA